jgi:hypothetical protein
MCDGLLLAVPRDMDKSQCPVVAVGRTVLTELDVLVRNDRSERVAGGDARVRPRPDFTGPGRQRDFNAGQPNLAPVVKDKAPSVSDGTDFTRAGNLETANRRRRAFLRADAHHQLERRAGHAENLTKPRKSDDPPAHAATRRSEWGGTAAMGAPGRAFSRRVPLICNGATG